MSTRIGATSIVTANTDNQLRKVTWPEMHKWFSISINAQAAASGRFLDRGGAEPKEYGYGQSRRDMTLARRY